MPALQDKQPVTTTIEGRHLVITIDRPAARNAISGPVAELIEAAIDRLESDDDLWTGVIAATPPVFCAGADLKATQQGAGRSMFTKRGGFAGLTDRVRSKPMIAAVDGAALAGGTEIVLACDLVVASSRASFGLPEVRRSLIASAGGLARLPDRIPRNVAMECALTGLPIDSNRAYQLGLVNILSDEDVVTTALELADRIARNAPSAVRASRRLVTQHVSKDQWLMARAELKHAMSSEDYLEGLAAFVDKRDPNWTGR